jgi:hypothetical protein
MTQSEINDLIVRSAKMALRAYGGAYYKDTGQPLTPEDKADIITANSDSWARRVRDDIQDR